jgi:hypothetical protein
MRTTRISVNGGSVSATMSAIDVQVFRVLHTIGALAHEALPHHRGQPSIAISREEIHATRLLINLVYRFCSPLCQRDATADTLRADVDGLTSAVTNYVQTGMLQGDKMDILLHELERLQWLINS